MAPYTCSSDKVGNSSTMVSGEAPSRKRKMIDSRDTRGRMMIACCQPTEPIVFLLAGWRPVKVCVTADRRALLCASRRSQRRFGKTTPLWLSHFVRDAELREFGVLGVGKPQRGFLLV